MKSRLLHWASRHLPRVAAATGLIWLVLGWLRRSRPAELPDTDGRRAPLPAAPTTESFPHPAQEEHSREAGFRPQDKGVHDATPSSLILRTGSRYLLPLLLLYSLFLFLRGHHEPGGGFIGGLVAVAALALCTLAYSALETKHVVYFHPRVLVGTGLLLAFLSGTVGWLHGKPFLTAAWSDIKVPGVPALSLGTPVLFDLGVYLVVIGAILLALLQLERTQ